MGMYAVQGYMCSDIVECSWGTHDRSDDAANSDRQMMIPVQLFTRIF